MMRVTALTLGLLIVSYYYSSSSVFAQEYMSQEKIKKVFTDKTINAEHLLKGFKFKVYFAVDGKTAFRTKQGEVIQTAYGFEGDKHCILWKGKNRCSNIIDNGDGTYIRVSGNGQHLIKWFSLEDGKKL